MLLKTFIELHQTTVIFITTIRLTNRVLFYKLLIINKLFSLLGSQRDH
jgi:hypothetical protein